jgi:hypothetical protein
MGLTLIAHMRRQGQPGSTKVAFAATFAYALAFAWVPLSDSVREKGLALRLTAYSEARASNDVGQG